MTKQDRTDITETAIAFCVFILTLSIGWALLGGNERLRASQEHISHEADKCPESHNAYQIRDGVMVWIGCTGSSSNYRGYVRE